MQFVDVNNEKYMIIDKISQENISETGASDRKNQFGYDVVLKKDNYFYFCRKIEEAKIIEEFISKG